MIANTLHGNSNAGCRMNDMQAKQPRIQDIRLRLMPLASDEVLQ
jgi:hypothetical protein